MKDKIIDTSRFIILAWIIPATLSYFYTLAIPVIFLVMYFTRLVLMQSMIKEYSSIVY